MSTEVIPHIKRVESDFYVVSLRADGIIHVHYKDDAVIDLHMQNELEQIFFEMTAVDRPLVMTSGEFISVTREAREYTTLMEQKAPISGFIPVIQNLAHRILADHIFQFNGLKKPIRCFNNLDDAVQWIKENFEIQPIKRYPLPA